MLDWSWSQWAAVSRLWVWVTLRHVFAIWLENKKSMLLWLALVSSYNCSTFFFLLFANLMKTAFMEIKMQYQHALDFHSNFIFMHLKLFFDRKLTEGVVYSCSICSCLTATQASRLCQNHSGAMIRATWCHFKPPVFPKPLFTCLSHLCFPSPLKLSSPNQSCFLSTKDNFGLTKRLPALCNCCCYALIGASCTLWMHVAVFNFE